jgi:hypothetical protein
LSIIKSKEKEMNKDDELKLEEAFEQFNEDIDIVKKERENISHIENDISKLRKQLEVVVRKHHGKAEYQNRREPEKEMGQVL